MSSLSVHSFRSWCPTLDQALQGLPEDADWSHDLYRSLIDVTETLRVLLWIEHDLPIAMIAFTIGLTAWQPITHWLLPGFIGPHKPGRLKDILSTIPFPTELAWWRMPEPLPAAGRIHVLERESTFGLPCNEPFSNHWRTTGVLKHIRRYRRKCASLEAGLNVPGAAEWVIRSSEEHWNSAPNAELDARLEVARQLEAEGKLFCVSLSEGDRLVGGSIVLVHRGDGIAWVTFRDRDKRFGQFGLGTVLMADLFEQSKAMGLSSVDIGGSYEYKKRWARPMGSKTVLITGPLMQGLWRKGAAAAQRLHHSSARHLRRLLMPAALRRDARKNG